MVTIGLKDDTIFKNVNVLNNPKKMIKSIMILQSKPNGLVVSWKMQLIVEKMANRKSR